VAATAINRLVTSLPVYFSNPRAPVGGLGSGRRAGRGCCCAKSEMPINSILKSKGGKERKCAEHFEFIELRMPSSISVERF
jgi:hypothetical protein